MLTNHLEGVTFNIEDVTTCDFEQMEKLDNQSVLAKTGSAADERLLRFVTSSMGIEERYWCKADQNALTLARDAMAKLLQRNPKLVDTAEFLIFAGISNPYPVTTISALLGGEYGLKNVSCWDLKSGCSTALLAMQQALGLIKAGAGNGIIVAAENLTRFSNPNVKQMALAIGDGACALHISNKATWKVKSSVHGTDPAFSSYMRVEGEFPYNPDNYQPQDYYFGFANKPEGIEKLGQYWQSSLAELLDLAQVTGQDIQHYIAHQVDASKNLAIAQSAHIPGESVALNFRHFGNMGCPTIFINYHRWHQNKDKTFKPGDHLVFHAVGGGISWAGICAQHL